MANLIRKENTSRNIQLVFVAIRKNRPWDTRPAQNMYTTAQEKYLIELIKQGHSIPNEIIVHVLNRCTLTHKLSNGSFTCCHGYILIGAESEHLECKRALHILNDSLFCHNGFPYYPVDMLHNAFGDWRPDETHTSHDIQEVYELIRQKWPSFCNGDDAYKYTLKHLVDLIENGETVHKDVQKHVINGCTDCEHNLDDIFSCSSGYLSFLDRKKDERYEQNKIKYQTIREKLRHKQLHLLKTKTNSRQNKNLHKIQQRIGHRDFLCSYSTETILISPEQKYLINNVMSKDDVPNDVVSHAVENCRVYEHHLSEAFVCYRGYIYKRGSNFDFMKESYTRRLRRAEILSVSRCNYISSLHIHELFPNIGANIAPPPPPDFLDNNPMDQPVRQNVVNNPIIEGLEVNQWPDDAVNPAPNRPNLAPPPQEVDI